MRLELLQYQVDFILVDSTEEVGSNYLLSVLSLMALVWMCVFVCLCVSLPLLKQEGQILCVLAFWFLNDFYVSLPFLWGVQLIFTRSPFCSTWAAETR